MPSQIHGIALVPMALSLLETSGIQKKPDKASSRVGATGQRAGVLVHSDWPGTSRKGASR